MATPFMNLDLPVVSVTLGPEWATELNTALETIDEHDHTSGKGTAIPTAGIDIDADLDLNSFRLIGAMSLQLEAQGSPLSGGTNVNSLNVSAGNLYFTNGSGTAVQLTDGNSIVAPSVGLDEINYTAVNTDLIIGSASTVVFLAVDTSAARSITLPSASAVGAGRFYIIKDATNQSETNNISILTTGGDSVDVSVVNSNGAAIALISNGSNAYKVW